MIISKCVRVAMACGVSLSVMSAQVGAQELAPQAAPAATSTSNQATGQNADDAQLAWQQEYEVWKAAAAGDTVEEYESYLALYPQGKFAEIAKSRIVRHTAEVDTSLPATAEEPEVIEAPEVAVLAAGSPETEAVLLSARATRREVQGRLSALGFSTGGADGVFGPRSRAAISQWQAVAGAPVNGFLSYDQLAKLRTDSEQVYQAWLAARKNSKPVLIGKVKNSNSNADAAIALGVMGLAAGIIGAAAVGGHHHHRGPGRMHCGPGMPCR